MVSAVVFAENINFADPISTPLPNTSPNLTSSGDSPQIATDSSGRLVYAIWDTDGGPIQVVLSEDGGENWQEPILTPTKTIPDLASAGFDPQITTDSSGQYVYAIWQDDSPTGKIQVARSENYGKNWKNPTSTPTGSIPDLASSGETPQITTDSSGQYVYAIWQEEPNEKIQVAISEDFGKNWENPDTTPTNNPPDLASAGFNPQITTDSTGQFVYAIWRANSSPFEAQVAISEDFGKNWKTPDTTPIGSNTPNLSSSGGYVPQITTDSTGQFVYAIWQDDINNGNIQIAISEDAGKNWINPTSTPTNTIPNLTTKGARSQITTDITGRLVYAIWQELFDGGKIQIALSKDGGKNWINPTSTPTGSIPDLATAGLNPQITASNSGRYVYAIWQEKFFDGKIQIALSEDFGKNWINPTSTPRGGIPNLTNLGFNPQIITDSTGSFVYAIWHDALDLGNIQVAIGIKSFFPLTNMNIKTPN